MALELGYIMFENFASDANGDLVATGHKIRYVVRDTVDNDLTKSGELTVDEIDDSDTVATWWGKVQQQVKDAEGIT